jgi:hypothetical protein
VSRVLLYEPNLSLELEIDPDHRLVGGASLDRERPQLDVGLHRIVVKLASNQALRIEHGVVRVDGNLQRKVLTHDQASKEAYLHMNTTQID